MIFFAMQHDCNGYKNGSVIFSRLLLVRQKLEQQQESEDDLAKSDYALNAENAALTILNKAVCFSFLLCGRTIRFFLPHLQVLVLYFLQQSFVILSAFR